MEEPEEMDREKGVDSTHAPFDTNESGEVRTRLDDVNSLQETAGYLKIPPAVLARLAREQRIDAVHIGRTTVFTKGAIAKFIIASTVPALGETVDGWGRPQARRKRD